MLGHVRDLGMSTRDPNVRIYQTTERQNFHTDSCDIVALLCLQTAKSGGLSSLTSSMSVYNAMATRRPDLAARLLQPFPTDRRGEVPDGKNPVVRHSGVQRLPGLSLGDLRAALRTVVAALPGRSPADGGGHGSAGDVRTRWRRIRELRLDMEFRPGRHAVRAQSHDPARPHCIRGLAGAGTQAPPAASVARRAGCPAAAAGVRGALRQRGRSATAAASSATTPGCTRRWSRCRKASVPPGHLTSWWAQALCA